MERDYAQLRRLIQEEHLAVERLIVLLGCEREALSSRDLTAIQQVTQEKNLTLDTVERASEARAAWALDAGIDSQGDALEHFIMDSGDSELPEAWESLCASLRDAHRENLVNGRIISRSRQTLSHLLGILRGQVDNAPRLYGRGGHTGSTSDCGEIARA